MTARAPSSEFTIEPRGPFSLAAATRFLGGWEATAGVAANDDRGGAAMRVAFTVDDWSGAIGLSLRQAPEDGALRGAIVAESGDVDRARARRQLEGVLSLDGDGAGYVALGERDVLIGARQRSSGFLRPVLFNSPYEAACWAIIAARRHHRQARSIRARMSAELTVDGAPLEVFPAPAELLGRDQIEGLSAEHVARLHGVARAALAGELDRQHLLALGQEEAIERLQRLRGIGPFWAALIFVRGAGPRDALAAGEPRLRRAVAAAYERPELERDDGAFAALAETWRPYRTWVSVLLRATAAA